jgi:hypothetical protein
VLAWHRTLLPVACAGALLAPRSASAWETQEHQQLGRTAYADACAELVASLAVPGAPPAPGVAGRLEIACGRNRAALADIYGSATALAGDFLNEPGEFISQAGAWRFKSNTSYWLLALENSAHFNPMSMRSWAEYHLKAIAVALDGAHGEGLESLRGFQLALQESAFADHFLHDSFAAGHMGFNRTASSAAASKSFHDAWNKRGRVISDRHGDRWVTFGDGRLNAPANEEGRRHVQTAATLSVRNVLRAFVLGVRTPGDEIAVWRILPFTMQAPELHVDVIQVFQRGDTLDDRQLVPLLKTIKPVRKDTVLTGSLWSAVRFSEEDSRVTAAVAGFELAVPYVPAQTYLAAGGTLREPGGKHSAVLDAGLLFPLGLSLSGLVSYQLNTTASWLIRRGASTLVHADLQVNIELGDVLINLAGGLVDFVPGLRLGWFASAGMGYTFSAAGGGTL